jgi:hypothetical protein
MLPAGNDASGYSNAERSRLQAPAKREKIWELLAARHRFYDSKQVVGIGDPAMMRQEVQRLLPQSEVVLRSGPNWTGVWFFTGLTLLHTFVATTAFWNERWEGFMSILFGIAFAMIAIGCLLIRHELTVQPNERRVRLRTGTRRIYAERFVPFQRVQSVRLTLLHPRTPKRAHVELVCEREVIDCPSTQVPRAEALCLAVTIGARLIKVYGDAFGPVSERMERMHLN